MDIVNERTSSVQPCTFKDENGNTITPDTATYQIDDASGTNITPAGTAFTPPNINISAADNRILDSTKSGERRKITVRYTYGSGKAGADEHEYMVKNLSKVS